MREWNYIRNLDKLERHASLTNDKLAAALGISFSTLRRLRKGMPASEYTVQRIERGAKRLRWKHKLKIEKPSFTLKLNVNPRMLRYQRLELIDPNKLISADVLSKVIAGHAFTKSFAEVLRYFFRNIALTKEEYDLQRLTNPSGRHFVEEWKQKIPSLTTGDQLIDLHVLLRKHFRAFIEQQAVTKAKHAAMKKTGSVEVSELRIPTSSVQSLSVAEQNLFIALSLACNELGFLTRLATISGHQTRSGRIYDAFLLSQQMTVIKLFAGKILESWRMFQARYFGSSLSKIYDPLLSRTTKRNLKAIKTYFNKSKNIIAVIRNEAAFHYSKSSVHEALEYVNAEQGCLFYFATGRRYNNLYHFGEVAMAGHLLSQLDADRSRAIRIAQDEISDIGDKMSLLLTDILSCLIKKAVHHDRDSTEAIIFHVGLERKTNAPGLPIFIHPNDYYNEYTKLRRSL